VDRPLAPGLHVQTDAVPLTQARLLADDLDAQLCATDQEADDLLAELAEFPPLDVEGVALVRDLGERLIAARRIVERTVDRAAVDVSERLAAVGAGVAVHPATVRERAAAVVAAREALRRAEDDLEAMEATAAADEAAVVARLDRMAELAPVTSGDTPASVHAPRRRRGFFRRFSRSSRGRRDEQDTSESTSLLQQMAVSTDEAFGARRAVEARSDQLVSLQAERIRAQEQVRVAERAWQDLAGGDAVEDVDTVVLRFDPQHQEARDVAQDAVGVRAVSSLLDHATARWEEGWRSLGLDPPKPVEDGWIEHLVGRMDRPIVLVAGAVDRAERLVQAAPAVPVLVVEPAS
jgi:hypothetical protein